MAKDPAFLFYVSDFLTGTMFMNNEQVGIYVRLLCSQHQHGGMIDKDSFESLVGSNQLVRGKFVETEGGFYNERLALEMGRRNKKSNNISEAVQKVWDERKRNAIALESQKDSNGKLQENDGIPMRPVNVNKDVNKDVNINNDINIGFEEFWNLYNKKMGSKEKCEKAWIKLSDMDRQKIIDTLPLFLKSITDKQFQPYPQTYLNNKRWNDEIKAEDIKPSYDPTRPQLTRRVHN